MFELRELRDRIDEIYLTPPKRRTAELLAAGVSHGRIIAVTKLSRREFGAHLKAIEFALRLPPPSTRFVRFIRQARNSGGNSTPPAALPSNPPRRRR